MGRLARFQEHRFIGTRDDRVVYDCDDDGQFGLLPARVAEDDLVGTTRLSSFAPDSLAEARNRGFRPVPPD